MNGFDTPIAVAALESYLRIGFVAGFTAVAVVVAGFCMARFARGCSSRDHVSFSSSMDVHDITGQWADRNRYVLIHSAHQRRIYQRGDGALVIASVLEVDFYDGRYSISSYSKSSFLGRQRCLALSNRHLVGRIPRALEKRKVDELVASLGAVDSVAELNCDFGERRGPGDAPRDTDGSMQLWPGDPSSKIRMAWTAALVSGCITAGVGAYSMYSGTRPLNLDSSLLIDAVVIFALAFGVYKRSRVCAILLFVFFVLSKLFMMIQLQQLAQLPVAVVFGVCYWQGIAGAFAHHREKRASAVQR